MPKVTYIPITGESHTVDVPAGYSVMENAMQATASTASSPNAAAHVCAPPATFTSMKRSSIACRPSAMSRKKCSVDSGRSQAEQPLELPDPIQAGARRTHRADAGTPNLIGDASRLW